MPWTQTDTSFKKLSNKRVTTSTGKGLPEEKGASTLELYLPDIKTGTIPGTPPGATTDVLSYTGAIGQTLVVDTSVPGNLTWFATTGYGNTTAANDGSSLSESQRLGDWISDKYDGFGTVAGAGYEIKVYDRNSNLITKSDSSNWLFDYQTGILIFNNNVNSYGTGISVNGPYRVVGYRYIGPKGIIPASYGGLGYTEYTKGDILVGAGTSFIKLNVGNDNYVLTASSTSATGLTWSTTSATGITSLNSLTASVQYFAFGYSGSLPSFSSSGATHTLNIPLAGSGSTGLISTDAQTIAGQKTFTSTIIGDLAGTATTAGFASTAFYSHQSGYATTAGSAAIWTTPRTLTLAGDLTGSIVWAGAGDTTLTALIAANSVALGVDTTGQYASTITISGSGISATTANGDDGTAYTVYSSATNSNVPSTIVFRDGSGNFSAGTITASLSGTATTATYAHQSGYAITSGFASTATYAYESGYGLTSGLATTATYAHQSGYAITSGSSNTSGFATTAANLNVSNASTGIFFPVLSNTASSASGIGASVNSFFSFNAATGALGATSVNILSGQSYNVGGNNVLSATSLGTGVTNSSLTALGTITTGVWAGSLITGFYGGTGYNSYTKGDILVGAGSTFIKLGVGSDNFVLTANSSSATGLTWSLTAATGITTLNSLTATQQFFSTGTSGSGFNISSSGSTHTFNIPIAGTGATGLVSTLAQSFAGVKTFTNDVIISSTTGSTAFNSGALTVYGGLGVSGQLSFNQAALGYTGAINPSMAFIGSTTAAPITLTVLSDNSLLWEGTSGKLFGINNNLSSGWIFNVGDISGLPIIRANADGTIAMAEFAANVGIGLSNPSYKLHVAGDTNLSSTYAYRINGTSVLSATSLGTGVTNSSLTAVGTLTTGVWAATAITAFYGGTGYNSYTKGDILVGAGNTFIKLGVGSDSFVLTASSSSATGLTWSPTAATGLTTLNGLSVGIQFLAFGYSGTVPAFASSGSTHTLNIPLAGSGSTGLISTQAQTIAGQKTFTSAIIGDLTGTATTAGFASTANYAHQSGYAITSGFATTASYSYQSGYGITSGFATTANYAYQSGYGITSGFATTANYAHQSGYAITSGFASTSSYSYQSGYAITSGLASTATLALTVSSNSTIVNADYNIPFFSGTALSTNNSLYYNPSTGRFNAPIHTGTWAGNTITSFYGGTGFSTYSTGDLLVGAGATVSKLSVGTNNFILVADSAVPGGIKWANVSGFAITNINGLTASRQDLAFGYSGTVPAFSSSGSTHTLNIPLAGTGSTGLVSTQAQSFAGIKTFTNAVSITDNTGSGSYTSGALVVAGGVGVGGTLNVQGDLNVQGTFTTINSTTITVADKNIELGVVGSPSDLTAQGGGITLRGATDKSINWYSGVGWSSSESWNLASGNTFKINGTNVLSSTSLGTGVTNSSLTALGTVTTGVWSATAVTALYGGTGLVPSFTVGDILYANTTNTWGRLTANSNAGYVLVSAGSGATPTYVAQSTLSAGFASTSSYSHQSGYAITSGLATTATYSHQAGYASTSGLATTATYAHQSGYGITAGLATTATYAHQSGYAITSGSSAFATTATYAHQSGYAITSGFATTAANINVVSATTNTNHRVLFTPASGTASGAAVSIENTFVYNPSTDILSVSGLAVTASTNSTNSSTGALTVAGGVGIGGTVYTATDLNVGNSTTGRLYFSQATLGSAGTTVIPTMAFIGTTNSPITLSVLADNSLSFDGSSGQLFSINNNLSSGWIFAVNDISGLPLLRANADGTVAMGEFAGNVGIGLSNPSYKLHVVGDTNLSSGYVYRINGTQVLSSTSLGTGVTNSSLTAVGTITSGTWAGSLITGLYGGTGFNSYTKGDILVGAGTTLIKHAVGSQNQILIADLYSGSGLSWATFANPTYGSFYSTTSQPVVGVGATTLVNFNSTYESNRVSIIGGAGTSSRVQIQDAGPFSITFSAQINLTNGTQPKVGDFWFRVNGVDVPQSNTQMTITGKDYQTVITINFVYTFANNDYFEIAFSSLDTNYRIEALTGLTSPPRPDVPSIILSVLPITHIVGASGSGISGILSINGSTSSQQYFLTGRSGSDFNIQTGGGNHTFNIPYAGTGATGLVNTLAQSFAGVKTFTNDTVISSNTVSTSTSTGALTVTGGVGIGGSLYTGTSTADSISGVVLNNGVITTGSWSATAITAYYGGTGYQSYTVGDLLVGAGSTLYKLSVGTNNYVLTADNTAPGGVKWAVSTSVSASTGVTTINALTESIQYFATGNSGSGFNISSSGSTHTFNIPIAGTGSTGLVSTLAQSFAGIKTFTNDLVVSSSTVSTSTSTGGLTVTGGVGIGGSLFTGSSTADSISGVVLNNGVITTGSWSATAITAFYGGTGNTSYTLGDLLVGAGSTFIKLPVGINSYVLGADSSRPSGVGWTSVTPLTISDTPPASPKNADLWFNSLDGGLLVYYSDVDTNQWVEIALGSGIDLTQPVHITNTTASTSTTTGALIVDGGAGFASTIYAPVISINEIYDQISSTLTTSSTTADQVAMSLGSTVYRTLKLNVQMTSSTSYHSQEILMVHDGTLVYMTEYAIVNNGSILSTFDADISGGNIRLLVSPTNAVTTYKIACSAIRI